MWVVPVKCQVGSYHWHQISIAAGILSPLAPRQPQECWDLHPEPRPTFAPRMGVDWVPTALRWGWFHMGCGILRPASSEDLLPFFSCRSWPGNPCCFFGPLMMWLSQMSQMSQAQRSFFSFFSFFSFLSFLLLGLSPISISTFSIVSWATASDSAFVSQTWDLEKPCTSWKKTIEKTKNICRDMSSFPCFPKTNQNKWCCLIEFHS